MGHKNDILDLIQSSAGKAAPYMTEKLSEIGDGSMAEGLSTLAAFFAKAGMEYGEIKGLIKGTILGSLGTLTIFGGIEVLWNLHQKRIERTVALQEVDAWMKRADAEMESAQTDEVLSYCEESKEPKDGEEVQN